MCVGPGHMPAQAFRQARDEAYRQHGHGTGTIMEKSDFVLIDVPADKSPRVFARELLNADDPRIRDKWGPAGCVKLDIGTYLFFGWVFK